MGQINLNNFKVITDKLNTFFVDNKFMVASEIPTTGDFKVGDIIINNGPTNVDEPMWICVEAGNPGTWTVFNSGGGSAGGGKLTTARNRVVLNGESKSEVSIGISGFNKASDVLMVFINSRFMTEGVDYEINADSTKIVAIGEAWNEELSSEFEIEMIVFKMMGEEGVVSSVNEIVKLKNTVVVNEAVNEVEIGIEGFNEGDDLTVYRNSVYMIEGIDYEVQGNKIVSLKGAWNAEGGSDYKFTFEVLKAVAKVNPDAVVGMDNLKDDVKEAIEAAGNIDLSGYATKEELNGKVAQGDYDNKIAELEGKVNEAFTSANNGKQLIASAIGEPVSADDTFSAMSNDINGLLSTFKTNMMNNGIAVESTDKFKSLIDKIATMVEEGEGKGIQYATGDITGFNMEYNQTKNTTINIDFKPSFIFIEFADKFKDTNGSSFTLSSMVMSSTRSLVISLTSSGAVAYYMTFNINNITEESFNFVASTMYSIPSYTMVIPNAKWYAIGVGEEDTTLRDSLASILEEEGVDVTEEDDMASLITKVDSEFTKDNNTISEMEEEAENTRSTLAGLMQEGGYDITGEEDIDTLLGLLIASGIKLNEIKQIACGTYHNFILKTDGSLWGCGTNSYGQLGLGHNTDCNTFTQVTTNINNDVEQVVCGDDYTLILKTDGSLWACGYNYYGNLGLGHNTDCNTFTKVTTNINNDVKQMACGQYHTFILKNDGSVWACGKNDYGALGTGNSGDTYTSFIQVTTNINNDVKQVACGYNHTFILKNDGSVWSCGYNYYGQLGLGDNATYRTFTQVTTNINNDVKQIACGENHAFILKNDGSVWSCGYNSYGQLGIGENNFNQYEFTQVTTNINNVKEISCGGEGTFILKTDGSIWACGFNDVGQLGLGENDSNAFLEFTQVTTNINNDVKQITCESRHAFIIKNDGSAWACGWNNSGELGIGEYTEREVFFTQIPRGLSY